MKAITATPASVKEIFQKDYLIPNFQRPYSWGEDECEKFWDDILSFYDDKESKSEKYFFGNIVIYPSSNPEIETLEVVDGQQRLITLTLLIKALFDCAGTWSALEKCLKIEDPKSDRLTNELRVKTYVIANDMKALEEIIFNRDITNKKTNFIQNFDYFKDEINKWREDRTASEFDSFISMILNQIVLLPINCETNDDALTIFETINNRGKPLDDSDIFKAKLYGTAGNKDQFMKKWNEIQNHNWIFRVYMHILRAKKNNTDKEIALRKFFETEGSESIRDCEKTMQSLRIIHKIEPGFDDDEALCLWKIMDTYPNKYWNFPFYVFLHKHGKINEEDRIELSDKRTKEFRILMKETVKYFFIKGVIGRGGANYVKEAVFKINSKIESNKEYLLEYKNDITSSDKVEFNVRLEENRFGRFNKGIILLAAYLNPKQDMKAFASLLGEKYDIEHILPRDWNNYDGWDENTHKEDINLLGNTMPLDRRLNIRASNEFFARKKKEYEKSGIQDALDLIELPEWTRDELLNRNNDKIKLIKEFFEIKLI